MKFFEKYATVIAFIAMGFVFLFLLTTNAFPGVSQQRFVAMCNDSEYVHRRLNTHFKEYLILSGVTVSGKLMEVFAKKDGSGWTVLATDPQKKMSCIFLSGDGIEAGVLDVGTDG